MGNALGALFSDIAGSIRGGLGEIGKMKPNSFPNKIDEIVELLKNADSSDEYDALLDEINGEIVGAKIVTFIGADGSVLCTVPVTPGADCPNPVTTGQISRPAKDSTVTTDYTFSGWSLTEGDSATATALKTVTEDRTVYAAFTSSVRKYTVKFYDGDVVLYTFELEYGSTPSTTTPTGSKVFDRWEPELAVVTGDASYYAVWKDKLIFANASWAEIAEVCEQGTADQHFAIGDKKTISIGAAAGVAETIDVEIVGFNYDTLADGTGKASMSIMSVPALSTLRYANNSEKTYNGVTSGNSGGWSNSDIRAYCNGDFLMALPSELKAVIKPVIKYSDYGYADKSSYNTVQTTDSVWLASYDEIFAFTTGYPKFTLENDRIKYQNGTQNAVCWYLRNAISSNTVPHSDSWTAVGDGGSYRPMRAAIESSLGELYSERSGVVFGFCL